jgi:hypothetical protein
MQWVVGGATVATLKKQCRSHIMEYSLDGK